MDLKITKRKAQPLFAFGKVLIAVLMGLAFQQSVAQNTCATAVPIGPGTYTVAAIDGTNITSTCSNATMAEWYVYTPTENHSVTVTSDLSVNICKDTYVSVYTGTCAGLTCVASDDDSGVIQCNSGNTSSYLSKETFDAYAGVTYYIAWDNKWSALGFDFQLIEAAFVPSPCYSAIPVTAGVTTVPAIDGSNVTTSCSSAALAKWYRYTPTQDFHVTISSDLPVNLCKDTNFSVYTGSCSATLTCVSSDDNSGVLECNVGNTDSNLSKKTFDVVGGTTYYIAWDNKWSADGFDFEIIEEEIVIPVLFNAQSIPTLNSTYNICVVDMNGDEKDDMAGVSQNMLRVHFQGDAGALTYTDFPISGTSLMPGWSLAAGDYNKDGYTDLLLGNTNGVTFWKSDNTGTTYTSITPGDYIFCQRTNFADLNNDGNLDAFSCHDIAPNCYYINDGSGNMTFHQSSGSSLFGSVGGNYASIWTDYDNDGDSDLFVSKCSGPPCELHRNNGDGTYTDVASVSGLNFQPVSSWSSAVFDYDNDGDMDILVGSNGNSPTRLYRNDHDLGLNNDGFTNVTTGSGWDTNTATNRDYIAYDFDNNGFVDVLAGGGKIMFNQGDGSFLPTAYSGIGVGAVGDLNGDGFLDILNSTTVRYGVPNGNNWIKIGLQGIQSNSNGIGARVEIHGPWGTQIRDIRSGEGFGYMSTLNAHFGLGAETIVTSVIITWPSGVVDVIQNPTPNQSLSVLEGSSPLATPDISANVFTLYPNPAEDVLRISHDSTLPSIRSVEIFDMTGRLVLKPIIENDSLSVKALGKGTYIVVFRTVDGKAYTQKLLKK